MLDWSGDTVLPIGDQRCYWKQVTLVRSVVLSSSAEVGEGACSEARATLRDPIWVATLKLPLISHDPMIEKIWV